jgi:glycosyltransferase involved in cell wall biosynthesis
MRVLMLPHLNYQTKLSDGISQVVHHYFKHLPDFDIQLVEPEATDFDLVAGHVGQGFDRGGTFVCHTHGLHWTSDYTYGVSHYRMNARIIEACRHAQAITVPSQWVAEPFQRDMRLTPHVIPHGIDWVAWQHKRPQSNYVLWNKNRGIGVCDPRPVFELARRFPQGQFMTTFAPRGQPRPKNIDVIGLIPHAEMKKAVQSSLVYLSTTKETFGIGTLEAMASGVPVLGYDFGGNVDLIEHGINGYLARPDDYDDLAEGLAYCLRYRQTLSDNARESAKRWAWETACEQVAEVYRSVLEPQEPTVAVVIPVYNKSEQEIRRAIESVINQTFGQIELAVIDDGSNDDGFVRSIVESYRGRGNINVVFDRQRNSGVAIARNRGVALAGNARFVCCLDSDDWIAPRFIESCVAELEADPSLGIVYSALMSHLPDGRKGLSKWPPLEPNFDKQLKRHNQIPTCCVFRREMWERLGGYRQRYAPDGCGAEDAEFWLRAGAYGYRSKMIEPVKDVVKIFHIVTETMQRPAQKHEVVSRGISEQRYDFMMDCLFHYSDRSGLVSGNPNYREVDWTAWHPWVQDEQHPFASIATPKQASHPVRQYDNPLVSVIIPVGPGHEKEVVNALDSLEAQTFRRWEAIVVWDNEECIDATGLLTACPYIRFAEMAKVDSGAGAARNAGAALARAPFLLFLDADDWLYPDCLAKMLIRWNEQKSIIYTDYVGKAHVNDPSRLAPDLQKRLYHHDDRKNIAVIGYRAAEFDCERAQRQPESYTSPYGEELPVWYWCNVTALIPTDWHNEIGGFDEDMPSWEDVDYHIRLAQAGKCYYRIPEELMVYQFYSGERREKGRQDHQNLVQYLKEKYEGVEKVACSGCGGRRSPKKANRAAAIQQREVQVTDRDFVQAKIVSGNVSNRRYFGATVFEIPPPGVKTMRVQGGFRIDYGYRQGGKTYLWHREDVARMRDVQEVREDVVALPTRAPKVTPPPERVETPEPEPVEVIEEPIINADVAWPQAGESPEIARAFDLQALPGVSDGLAAWLLEQGVSNKTELLALGVEGLQDHKGTGPARAQMIIAAIEAQV